MPKTIRDYSLRDKTTEKKHCSFRLREDIIKMLDLISKNTGINKTEFIELAIIEQCLNFNINFEFEGIHFPKYLEVLKYEKLRKYQGKIRNSIMSKALFLNRVRIHLLKMMSLTASRTDIEEYIEEMKKEANLYPNSKELLKDYELLIKTTDFNPSKFREKLKEDLQELKQIKHVVNIDIDLE